MDPVARTASDGSGRNAHGPSQPDSDLTLAHIGLDWVMFVCPCLILWPKHCKKYKYKIVVLHSFACRVNSKSQIDSPLQRHSTYFSPLDSVLLLYLCSWFLWLLLIKSTLFSKKDKSNFFYGFLFSFLLHYNNHLYNICYILTLKLEVIFYLNCILL